MMLKKLGKVQVIDAETGKVVSEKQNAMTLLPPPGDVCQVCAVDHAWDQPHNQQSMYYQMHFHSEHGRWPTWSDAMAHCAPEVKAEWRKRLVEMMREHGMEIPEDLKSEQAAGRQP